MAKCYAYIGIFAWRYGSIPEDGDTPGTAITELEYLQAIKCKKETLIFLLREGVSLEPADTDTAKIKTLRADLSKRHWTAEFGDPVELSLAVVTAANSFRRRRFVKRLAKVITGSVVVIVLAAVVWFLYPYLNRSNDEPPVNNSNVGAPVDIRFNDWTARFTKSEKLEEHWIYPKLWSTEPGELAATNSDDEALLVKGQEMGIPNDLGGKQFKNFRAVFKIRFKSGSEKAAWVLRAQADRAGGYLFQLAPDGNRLYLSGWIYDRKQKGESLGTHPVPFGRFRESKSLTIDVVVEDNRFNYNITFVDDQPQEQIEPDEPQSGDLVVKNLEFKDNPNKVLWPLGTIGFKLTDDTSVMRVESVHVYVINQ